MNEELTHPLSQAVYQLLKGYCAFRESLVVEEVITEGRLNITVKPHMADFRLICGKGGRVIKALQFLVQLAGDNKSENYHVELQESYLGKPEEQKNGHFKFDPHFNVDKFKRLLVTWCGLVFERTPGMTVKENGDKLRIYLIPKSNLTIATSLVRAIDEVFYVHAIGMGRIVEIRKGQ